MTGVRAHLTSNRRPKASAFRVAAVLCLVLVALLAVIQVTHVHSFDGDADHCPLCVAMHSLVPLVVMVAAVVLVRIGAPAPASPETRPILRYWHPTLFTRPPPIAC